MKLLSIYSGIKSILTLIIFRGLNKFFTLSALESNKICYPEFDQNGDVKEQSGWYLMPIYHFDRFFISLIKMGSIIVINIVKQAISEEETLMKKLHSMKYSKIQVINFGQVDEANDSGPFVIFDLITIYSMPPQTLDSFLEVCN